MFIKQSFKNFLRENNIFLTEAGGQSAGKLELVKTDVQTAYYYTDKLFKKNNRDIDEELPDFQKNYLQAQQSAKKYGKTKRKDMPVITDKDVRALQYRLKKGIIDVNPPYGKHGANGTNPFPEGLTGKEAEDWLKEGLPLYDHGDYKDDVVDVYKKSVRVGDLMPIQQQIYVDKSVAGLAQFGTDASVKFFKSTFFIASSDLRIIDGHHRWLASQLVDPDMMVTVMIIDLPIKKLLPMTLAYGDAIGNKRNA